MSTSIRNVFTPAQFDKIALQSIEQQRELLLQVVEYLTNALPKNGLKVSLWENVLTIRSTLAMRRKLIIVCPEVGAIDCRTTWLDGTNDVEFKTREYNGLRLLRILSALEREHKE